jgi:hypothetical protein
MFSFGSLVSILLAEPTHTENALSTHAEASKMLETALQQMVGIIAGRSPLNASTNK